MAWQAAKDRLATLQQVLLELWAPPPHSGALSYSSPALSHVLLMSRLFSVDSKLSFTFLP